MYKGLGEETDGRGADISKYCLHAQLLLTVCLYRYIYIQFPLGFYFTISFLTFLSYSSEISASAVLFFIQMESAAALRAFPCNFLAFFSAYLLVFWIRIYSCHFFWFGCDFLSLLDGFFLLFVNFFVEING